jgi:hypothetical protein
MVGAVSFPLVVLARESSGIAGGLLGRIREIVAQIGRYARSESSRPVGSVPGLMIGRLLACR